MLICVLSASYYKPLKHFAECLIYQHYAYEIFNNYIHLMYVGVYILQQLNISAVAFHFPLARKELSSGLQLKPAAKRQRGIFHCCARLIFNFAAECSRRGCFISHHGFRRPWCNLGAKLTLSAIPEPGLLIMTLHCGRTMEPMTPTQRNSNGRLSRSPVPGMPAIFADNVSLHQPSLIRFYWYTRNFNTGFMKARFTKGKAKKHTLQEGILLLYITICCQIINTSILTLQHTYNYKECDTD